MTKRVDLFQADRLMGTRVTQYMDAFLWKEGVKVVYRDKIKECEKKIRTLDMIEGSILKDKEGPRETYEAEIASLKKKLADTLKNDENKVEFSFDDNDKKLYKAIEKAETRAQKYRAFQAWFERYALFTDDYDFISEFVGDTSGKRLGTTRKVVESNATEWLSDPKMKEFLNIFYRSLGMKLISVGVIKPSVIPEELRQSYENLYKKREDAKAQKAAKKAAKKAEAAARKAAEATEAAEELKKQAEKMSQNAAS